MEENRNNITKAMDNLAPFVNTNGLTNSSIKEISNFQDKLKKLQTRVSSKTIYEYIEHNIKLDGVADEIYDHLDSLKACETKAVSNEIPIIRAQSALQKKASPENSENLNESIRKFILENENSTFPLANIVTDGSSELVSQIKNLKVILFFNWIPAHDYFKFKNAEKAPQETSTDDNIK